MERHVHQRPGADHDVRRNIRLVAEATIPDLAVLHGEMKKASWKLY